MHSRKQDQLHEAKQAYTIEEFCLTYALGRSMAYLEIAAGRLRTRKVGRRTIILATDAEAWANALPEGGSTDAA